jgi:hypothetical protein
MYLIENSLRQAQRDGIAPSIGNQDNDNIDRVEPRFLGHRFESTANKEHDKRFTQFYEDKLAEKKLKEDAKKERLLQLLQELTE